MMLYQTWTLADSKIALDTVHDDNCTKSRVDVHTFHPKLVDKDPVVRVCQSE